MKMIIFVKYFLKYFLVSQPVYLIFITVDENVNSS